MNSRLVIWLALVWLFSMAGWVQPTLLTAAPAAEKGEQKTAAASTEVTLDTIYPTTVYPNPFNKRYDFEIVGQNLGKDAKDNVVEVIGKGPVEMEITKCAEKEPRRYEKPCLVVPKGMEGRKLHVLGYQPDPYQGPVQFQVRVNDKVSKPHAVTFAAYSQQAVFFMSLAGFIVLAWIIVRVILWKGVGYYEIQGKTYGPLASFFLDKQTDTYSLSKFQLLAWTSVAVFGYLYLFLCRVLIQWNFQWPSIPDGLPLLLGLSAGTTVLSHGITTSFGSKGSGAVHPSPADFISSGGMVVGERFQFFVWTLVGCLGFMFLLLRTDPATLTELPKVPDNFLYLMGFSSAGYLGGKAVRKAGPVIKVISITSITPPGKSPPNKPPEERTPKGPVLTINLKGENLGTKAGVCVKVDGKLLRDDQFWLTPKQLGEPPLYLSSEIEVSLDVGLIDELGKPSLLEGEHTLTLVNADGQASDVHFPVDPLIIDSIENAPADPAKPNARNLKVKGKNFGENTVAEWQPPQGAPIPADQVTRVSATELIVRLPAQATGSGKVTLISPLGLKASKAMNIP
jgi:hypothetical protein